MKRYLFGRLAGLLLIQAVLLGMVSCKDDLTIGEDPYAGGKEPFGISFLKNYSDPEIAEPGSMVTFFVKGLKKHEGKFEFLINDSPVAIESVSDSTITIRVPEKVSSGFSMIRMDNQFFNGPAVYIEGNVSVDDNYNIVNGFNYSVQDILGHNGGHIVVGAFTNFENEASTTVFRNGFHYVNSLGKSDAALNFQKGTMGTVYSINKQGSKYIASGLFSEFNKRKLNNIVRLNSDGKLDSMVVDVLNPTPERPLNGKDTVTAFNGGTFGGITGGTFNMGDILKSFPVTDNKVVAVGAFSYHYKVDYRYSSRENRRTIITPVRSVLRFKEDGSLDSTYMINNVGVNGNILGAVMQEDEKLIMGGTFTTFNNLPANRLVRLNSDGKIDPTFAVGSGPNGDIISIQYNPNIKKMVVTGRFTSFNGVPARGVVVLDKNGQVDPTFTMRNAGTGLITFAHILNNGRIVLSGGITEYDGVKRSSLLILNSNGEALQKYNNIGLFAGMVNSLVETTSSLGRPAILLGGDIFRVEKKLVRNIVKLEIKE
ncbi:DUF5008 domain-containing protein [Sphingobacterium psychroaquaticum]|uniref:DUF5008 domain-containing protein n=1 Tax=Sphingobacterium psychroaquaticum TaxID=561061 RepID=UPI00106D25A8|nr:DUF5008 domain-containing protein [Sphingobacterium psychroaquaticum]QBQ40426.1 DUF5008 domain-containing protein [Sphingobacterium psychroaquaticum]